MVGNERGKECVDADADGDEDIVVDSEGSDVECMIGGNLSS